MHLRGRSHAAEVVVSRGAMRPACRDAGPDLRLTTPPSSLPPSLILRSSSCRRSRHVPVPHLRLCARPVLSAQLLLRPPPPEPSPAALPERAAAACTEPCARRRCRRARIAAELRLAGPSSQSSFLYLLPTPNLLPNDRFPFAAPPSLLLLGCRVLRACSQGERQRIVNVKSFQSVGRQRAEGVAQQ